MQKTDSFPINGEFIAGTNSNSKHLTQSDEKRTSNRDPVGSIWPAFIGAIIVISLAILGMAIGAIFGNKPVRGSCGGLASQTNEAGETTCGACAKPTADCPEL